MTKKIFELEIHVDYYSKGQELTNMIFWEFFSPKELKGKPKKKTNQYILELK